MMHWQKYVKLPSDISLINMSLFVFFPLPHSNLDIDKLSGNYMSFLLYLLLPQDVPV